jgi:hypothetical protein
VSGGEFSSAARAAIYEAGRRCIMVGMTCSIPDCEKPVRARGWCQMHWRRWRHNGDPLVSRSPRLGWSARVDRSGGPDACWPYTGSCDAAGYGSAKVDGKSVGTHRLAYQEANGPIPSDVFVLHRCDNPPCCNPTHLFAGDQQANMDDMTSKGRGRTVAHRGEDNGYTTLTVADVRALRVAVQRGESQRRVAQRFGVSQPTVSRIVRGKTWGHLA